jgi:hypothetical protein
MNRILLGFLFCIFVQSIGLGQTLSVRQVGNCAIAGSANTCSISVTATAGDLDIFACYAPSTGNTTPPAISSVTSGLGTLQFPTAVDVGSYGTGVVNTVQSFAYVLPANSQTVASPIVITLANNTASSGGNCYLSEMTPSASGSTVSLATDFSYQPAATCSNCTQANVTANGTNEAFFQGFFGTNGYTGPTAVASPYNTNSYFPGGNGMGFAVAPNPGNGNGAAWTNSSIIPVMQTLGFSFNPSAFTPLQFEGFEAGTPGNAPTAADLTSGSKGWAGCYWGTTVDTILYATAASMPLLDGTGLLGDGASVAAGAGSLGLEAISTGSFIGNIQCQAFQSSPTHGVLSFKFNDNLASGDGSSCDCAGIAASNGDYAGFNDFAAAGRSWGLETAAGNGTHFTPPGGTSAAECGTAAGQGCTIEIHYNSGSGGVTATSVTPTISGSTITWAGTFTASQWPVGYTFSPASCSGTGLTNMNGQLFEVVTSSGSQLTTTTTNYTNGLGSPVAASGTSITGCTLTGQHAIIFYNYSGNVFAASFTAGETTVGVIKDWAFGDTIHTITSGDTFKWDSFLYSVTAQAPPVVAPNTCNANSCSSSDVQAALTACSAGGTVIIPACSNTTWTNEVSVAVTGPVTIEGDTTCTAGCAPGSGGSGLAFTDNTNITMSVSGNPALSITGASATNFVELKDLTITNTTGGGSAIVGAVNITGTHAQVSSRVDHLHVTNNNGTFLVKQGEYGLTDHILYNGNYPGGEYSFATFTGDFSSHGYLNWQDTTNFGTNQAEIIEDSNFASGNTVMDGYFGCKATIRYSQIFISAGQTHGTDSGSYRSCVDTEIYNNTFTSTTSSFGGGAIGPFGPRGGTLLFHGNVMTGLYQWNGIQLLYFRASASDFSVTSSWGLAQAGLNWTPQTQGGTTNTLNASAYQTSHNYAAEAIATLSSGGSCNVQTAAGGTTGSSAPTCPAYGSTVTDTGGVVWENVGGTTSAGPGGTGFLSTDNETTCISGVNCTRYFDTNGGVYPFRDQPCLIHGQVVYGCYQWNNTGAQVPSSWWSTDASSAIQLNRDYFNASPAGYTPYTYPDPLQGASGPISSYSPTSLSFSTQVINTTSSPQTITLTNIGSSNLVTTSIALQTGTQFAIVTGGSAGTCVLAGQTIAPSGSCTIKVTFTPTSTGAKSDNVVVTSNAPSSPDSLSLSGTGISALIKNTLVATYAPTCATINCSGNITAFNNFNTNILPNISGIEVQVEWSLIDNCNAAAPCNGEPNYNWSVLDTDLQAYTTNAPNFTTTGCAGGNPCKIVLDITAEGDSGNDNTTTPPYVFNYATYATNETGFPSGWCPTCNPQDVMVCKDRQGGSTGWPSPPPFTGTFGSADYATWNQNTFTILSGSDLTPSGLAPFTNFSGFPVVYEKPIVTAYELFLTALFKHYSSSGTSPGPSLAGLLEQIHVGAASGGENYPYCSIAGPIPQSDWPGASASVPSGYAIRPSVGNSGGWLYYARIAGNVGATEPSAWCQQQGCQVPDGTVVWLAQAAVPSGSSGSVAWPGPQGQSAEAGGYTNNGYLSQWPVDGVGFQAQLTNFLASLASPIPIVLASHTGPPDNTNNLYSDVEAQLAAQAGFGFGMQGFSIADPVTFAAGVYPTTADNWAANFGTFRALPIIRHLQTLTDGNSPFGTGFTITNIAVSGATATVTCGDGNCGGTSGYCANTPVVYITGNIAALNGTQQLTSCPTNTTVVFSTTAPAGTYNGGFLWGPGYPPVVLPFATQHFNTEMELHECQLDYIFGTVTAPSPGCIGMTGPDAGMQQAIVNYLAGTPNATSSCLGRCSLNGTGGIK